MIVYVNNHLRDSKDYQVHLSSGRGISAKFNVKLLILNNAFIMLLKCLCIHNSGFRTIVGLQLLFLHELTNCKKNTY